MPSHYLFYYVDKSNCILYNESTYQRDVFLTDS